MPVGLSCSKMISFITVAVDLHQRPRKGIDLYPQHSEHSKAIISTNFRWKLRLSNNYFAKSPNMFQLNFSR